VAAWLKVGAKVKNIRLVAGDRAFQERQFLNL
jgi:hypothetical protein